MAWFAKYENDPAATFDTVSVTVGYYDDQIVDGGSNPVQQFATTFSFPLGSSKADMDARIVETGQSARKAKQRAAALKTVAPAGTIVAIP